MVTRFACYSCIKLASLAQAAYRLTGLQQVTAVLDARMQEVYIANFSLDEDGIMHAVDEEKLLNYEQARIS
jgi:tRNA threonylcarbamoyladenosine biosynthesis protein TsaB